MRGSPSYEKCQELLQRGKLCYSLAELRNLFHLSHSSFKRMLRRLQDEDDLIRLVRGYYGNVRKNVRLEENIGRLYSPSYISRESALFHHGIMKTGPQIVTCVTLNRSRQMDTALGGISFVHLPPNLYFGFEKEGQLTVASPEKALADYVFIQLRTRPRVSFRSMQINKLKWKHLRSVLLAFPRSVKEIMAPLEKRCS